MKCYHHHEKDAVGSCKHCFKAGCPDCLTEVHQQLSCHNKYCKQEIDEYDHLMIMSKRIYSIGKYKKKIILSANGLFLLGFTIIAFVFAFVKYQNQRASWVSELAIGLFCLFLFILNVLYQKRIRRR